MTAQMKDKFIFRRREYTVSAVEDPDDLINIHALGFNPSMFSTACYRGYIAGFSIYKNSLALKNLYTNNGSDLKNSAPVLNKTSPRIIIKETWPEEVKKQRREFVYENINLKIQYTGSVLITKDFIQDKYVHMGFQSPINYENIIQLTFDNGLLILERDFSQTAKLIREKKLDVPKEDRNIFAWIDDCFDISYSSKANDLACENTGLSTGNEP